MSEPTDSIIVQLRLARPGFTLEVDLTLPGRGVTGLLGRSGSGKTTLLRAMAGLERASGQLLFQGEIWQDARTFRPVHQRPIGYVFQESSLFAHLDVRGNLEFGCQQVARHERWMHWDDAVDLLGLASLLPRRPQ